VSHLRDTAWLGDDEVARLIALLDRDATSQWRKCRATQGCRTIAPRRTGDGEIKQAEGSAMKMPHRTMKTRYGPMRYEAQPWKDWVLVHNHVGHTVDMARRLNGRFVQRDRHAGQIWKRFVLKLRAHRRWIVR
jgi:hypothetical protein